SVVPEPASLSDTGGGSEGDEYLFRLPAGVKRIGRREYVRQPQTFWGGATLVPLKGDCHVTRLDSSHPSTEEVPAPCGGFGQRNQESAGGEGGAGARHHQGRPVPGRRASPSPEGSTSTGRQLIGYRGLPLCRERLELPYEYNF